MSEVEFRPGYDHVWLWTWAKPLRLWQVILFGLAALGRLGAPYLNDASKHVPNTWIVPPYASLETVTGKLALSYFHEPPGVHPVAAVWGQLLLDDNSVLQFTCKPGIGDPSCAYTPPYNRDPNIGKRIQIRFFESPNKQGPTHVIMEMRGVGPFNNDVVLSYSDSVQRLQDYKSQAGLPSFSTIIFWSFVVFMAPGLINRLVTGREAPPPKVNPKRGQVKGI